MYSYTTSTPLRAKGTTAGMYVGKRKTIVTSSVQGTRQGKKESGLGNAHARNSMNFEPVTQ